MNRIANTSRAVTPIASFCLESISEYGEWLPVWDTVVIHQVTIRPPTTVNSARPCSFQPMNGVLRDLERNESGETVHSWSRSNTLTSAGAPDCSVPPGIPRIFAGVELTFATQSARERTPGSTSRV